MVDTFNASYVLQPSDMVVSEHSTPTHSEESDNSTSSPDKDDGCEEQCPPRNNKKRRRKICHIIKYVIEFSFVKKLKMNKKSRKQRNRDDDTTHPSTSRIHNNRPPPNSRENEGISRTEANTSPVMYVSSSSSPLPTLSAYQLNNSTTSDLLTNTAPEKGSTTNSEAMASTKKVFGFLRMHMMLIVILAALVVSGKAWAILCTIVCLILLPLTSRFSNGRHWRFLHKEEEAGKLGRNNNNIHEIIRTMHDPQKVDGSLEKEVWVPATSFKW